jgi:hypothetical protein
MKQFLQICATLQPSFRPNNSGAIFRKCTLSRSDDVSHDSGTLSFLISFHFLINFIQVAPLTNEFYLFLFYGNAVLLEIFVYCWFGNEVQIKVSY